MRLPWQRRRVLVTERRFKDLRPIVRQLKRSIPLWRRLRSMIQQNTLRRTLDEVLRWADPPRRLLLVAHGAQGRLVAAREGDVDKFVDADWWGDFDGSVDVLAFGCESAGFVKTYDLARRCGAFVGFHEKVRFYRGSKLGRDAMARVCKQVADMFMDAPAVDDAFVEKLRSHYDLLIREYGHGSTDFARRLVLIELERQLESLDRAK
jgi:hypothetical protein